MTRRAGSKDVALILERSCFPPPIVTKEDSASPLDPAALVPEGVWRELRQAIFDAKIWAAHELFFGSDPWMGLSVDYRRRLRVALRALFGWMANEEDLMGGSDVAFAQPDSLFGGLGHTLLGVPYEARHRIGALGHGLRLAGEGRELVEGATLGSEVTELEEGKEKKPLPYWTPARIKTRHLPVLRSVVRLLMSGRNRMSRALFVGATLKTQASFPDVMRPVVPVDGPEPRSLYSALESGYGVWLSRMFDIQAAGDEASPSIALATRLAKMPSEEFDLGILDPRLAEVIPRVSVGALRSQWAIVQEHPQLVSFGGYFWFGELAFLRHGLAKQYPSSVSPP
jgi:hypothetical protein